MQNRNSNFQNLAYLCVFTFVLKRVNALKVCHSDSFLFGRVTEPLFFFFLFLKQIDPLFMLGMEKRGTVSANDFSWILLLENLGCIVLLNSISIYKKSSSVHIIKLRLNIIILLLKYQNLSFFCNTSNKDFAGQMQIYFHDLCLMKAYTNVTLVLKSLDSQGVSCSFFS